MPQVFQLPIIREPAHYNQVNAGLFSAGGLGTQLLAGAAAPLVTAGGKMLGEAMGLSTDTPQEEAMKFELGQKQAEAGRQMKLDHDAKVITDDQYAAGLAKYGMEVGDARLQATPDQIANYDHARFTLQGAGRNPQTGVYDGIETPEFTIGGGVAGGGQPGDNSQNPLTPAPDMEGIPYSPDSPKTLPPPSAYDSSRINEPGYKESFMQPARPTPFYHKLDAAQQKQAQLISTKLQGYADARKLYTAKEISSPEQRAAVYANMRATEEQMDQMVAMHNEVNAPGDLNYVKAHGGFYSMALEYKKLQFMNNEAYLQTLSPEGRKNAEDRIKVGMTVFQNLPTFQMGMVQKLAGSPDAELKLALDYTKNNQDNVSKERMKAAELTKDYAEMAQVKIPNMQIAAQGLYETIRQHGITNQQEAAKIGLDIQKEIGENNRFAVNAGLKADDTQVQLYTALAVDRRAAQKNQIEALSTVLKAQTDVDVAKLKGMGKIANGLGIAKDLNQMSQVARTLQVSGSSEADRKRGAEMQSRIGEIGGAALIANQAMKVENLLPMVSNWLSLPAINPQDPAGSRAAQGAAIVNGVREEAGSIIDQLMKAGQYDQVTPDLLNLKNNLRLNPNGTVQLTPDALTDESANSNVKTKDKAISLVATTMAGHTLSGKLPLMDYKTWMDYQSPTTGGRMRDIPQLKDPAQAKKFYAQYYKMAGGK